MDILLKHFAGAQYLACKHEFQAIVSLAGIRASGAARTSAKLVDAGLESIFVIKALSIAKSSPGTVALFQHCGLLANWASPAK